MTDTKGDYKFNQKIKSPDTTKKSKKNDLFLLYILDGSGSMADIQDDVVTGVNEYIEEQKKQKGKTVLSFTVFDTGLYPLYSNSSIDEFSPVTKKDTLKGGFTALLDAVGSTLEKAKENTDTKKMKKLVVIQTDGKENSSKKYTSLKVNSLITELQNEGTWTFVFIGSDVDAWDQAKDLGFYKTNTISTSKINTAQTTESLIYATNMHRYARAMSSAALADTYMADVDEDKKKQKKVLTKT